MSQIKLKEDNRPERRLIIVAPPYLTKTNLLSALFSGITPMEPASNGAPQYRDPALDLIVTDISALDHQSFNLAMLSARADMVLLFVDAIFGLEKRKLWSKSLACLAHIPNLVLGIDNMAHTGWSKARFEELKEEFSEHAGGLKCGEISSLPVNHETMDNIVEPSQHTPWYDGPPLISLLSRLKGAKSERAVGAPEQSSDQFAVHLCWTGGKPMLPGRHYILKHGDEQAEAHISDLKYRLNPATAEHQATKKLNAGEVGYGNISLDNPISFEAFELNRDAGSFTLHDKVTDKTIAFGLIKHELRRATNIKWHELQVNKTARAASKHQKPSVLWFTGLSGSGKSTIADFVDKKLHALGHHTYLLDGDNVRHGLCRDLGFTDTDRVENLRRISETTKLFVDAGLIVLVSFISPFVSERRAARKMFADGEFLEIFVDTPLEVCESRDPKGLYKKARAGQLKNFTGIDSPYEPPTNAEIPLPGASASAEQLADMIIAEMSERGLIPKPSVTNSES